MQTSFNKADIESVKNTNYIPENFPKKPIYYQLLNPKTTNFFKRVHPLTEPAKRLLLSENFSITNHIDIFDGGPKLEAMTHSIRTIKNSIEIPFKELSNILDPNLNYLISNTEFGKFNSTKITKKSDLSFIKKVLNVKNNDSIILIKERE